MSSVITVPGQYSLKLLASFDNSKNPETVSFEKEITVTVELSTTTLQETIERHTSENNIEVSAGAKAIIKLVSVSGDTKFSHASTSYRQHTNSLQSKSTVTVSKTTTVKVPVGAGAKLDIYSLTLDGPAGLMETAAVVTVPGDQTPPTMPAPEFVFQIGEPESQRFRIQNKVSKLFLLAGSYGANPHDRKVWQYPESEMLSAANSTKGFVWETLDDGRIQNVDSKMFLLAGSFGISAADRNVWQYPESEKADGKMGFVWTILPDGRIQNTQSKLFLVAGSFGTNPQDRNVWQLPKTEHNIGYHWELVPV